MDERAAGFRIRRFDEPDERRELELGSLELLGAGSLTLGRARYEPGRTWSEHDYAR
jgi:hypothetical protein